ncbi:hypothetical protein [Amycolatopsis echigonensis]|uniref:Uncharacterized protein n=1 Tax=Amycolatopsis echigonensis TaxID=2576905 RepID=A0A2N3WE67_9PSEU|nr:MULTISPECIES: hypothetical protein [Amycolatopsis]MBB2499659.1 hypothetical protein [Amycolatopsis echigonensis]PKV92182.1 hypothetical protein ATK30_2977 [Amycolatopsis niigatensis]
MSRKNVPNPELVTVDFAGTGPETYEAIAAEHGPKLSALADRSADPAEAAKLRELAAQLARLRTRSRADWLVLMRDLSESYRDIGRPAREAVTALVDAYTDACSADDRAASDSHHVNRALAILAARRPDAYAAVAAVLAAPGTDPGTEKC